MRRIQWKAWGILLAAVAVGAIAGGCGKSDAKNETVATVNAEEIQVRELREFMGMAGGSNPLPEIPVEKKKEALERLTAGRLLAQEAKAKGIDNTQEFQSLSKENERNVWVNALFRQELDARMKISEKEIKAEAEKIKGGSKGMGDVEAAARAARAISDRQVRKIEDELVAAAKKEIGVSVDQAVVDRIAKGEDVPESTAVATVGAEKVLFGDMKKVLDGMAAGGPHAQKGGARNPAVVGNLLDREVGSKVLYLYAKKQKVDGSGWYKRTKDDMDRSILINLFADKVVLKDVAVSEKEIQDAYAEHAQMLTQNGKKIPLAEVREQLQKYLQNQKRGKALEAYIAELKKKAKITVNESVLPKV